MGIVLALASAVAYGISDFYGGLFSRRANPWLVAVLAQVTSMIIVAVSVAAFGGDPTTTDLLWGAASGIGSGAGTFFLYRGLGGGQMNVVAPLSAVGAAIVPVVAGVALDERPAALAWVGIVVALPAIWLVSQAGTEVAAASGRPQAGVRDGLLAGAGFGLLFISLGQVPESAGLGPLAVGQAVAVAILGAGALAARVSLRTASRGTLGGAVVVGAFAAAATVLYQLAVRGELVSVTAVLTSLYPAITVLLAAVLLHERMNRTQAVGLALAGAAVVLVALP